MLANSKKIAAKTNSKLLSKAGVFLKNARESRGLSQRELADALDLSYYTFISQLENGRGKIPANRYRDWAEALGQDPREFVKKIMSFYDPITYEILFKDAT